MSFPLARRLPSAIPRAQRTLQRAPLRCSIQARLQSTTATPPPQPTKPKKGTWRGSFLRWGLAGYAVWWYNTSPVFAEEPEPQTIPAPSSFSDADLPTISAIVAQKRASLKPHVEPQPSPTTFPSNSQPVQQLQGPTESPPVTQEDIAQAEEEAQGAFNPVTGEINWDCPCLGGMADGPCGPEFKAAFSCFVFSKVEPKGMDCIENFQTMQTCFRKHPDVYGDELRDDDEYEARADTPAPAAKEAEEKSQDQSHESPKNGTMVGPAEGPEDMDRRVDARGFKGAQDEAEEGRRVDATDAGKVMPKKSKKQAKKEAEKA